MFWQFESTDASEALKARKQFVAALRRANRPLDTFAAEVVFGELVGNVVRHAPGPVRIGLELDDDAVLRVHDEGRGFAPRKSLPDPLDETGRGLFLVSKLAKEMKIERISGDGMSVCVVLT